MKETFVWEVEANLACGRRKRKRVGVSVLERRGHNE